MCHSACQLLLLINGSAYRDGVAVERPMPESQTGDVDPRDSDESGGSVLKGRLARIVPPEEPWLTEAAARLREGKLVAFPTGEYAVV